MVTDHSAREETRYSHSMGYNLFNDTLNTFYLLLYGAKHMVKDHTDSERENLLPPHRLLFPISSKGSFICTILQTIMLTGAKCSSVVRAFAHGAMGHWIDPSWSGPIELFLV